MKILASLIAASATVLHGATAQTWGGCQVTGGGTVPSNPTIDPSIHTCTTNQTGCDGQADVVFVMDGSGSVNAEQYSDAMDFLTDLAMSFPMHNDLVNVGMVQYSGGSTGTCDSVAGTCSSEVLNSFVVQTLSGDSNQICATIDQDQIEAGTPILAGLQVAHCALKGSTRNVAQFIVFITDGKPSGGATEADEVRALAEIIRNETITIFAIGVGSGADHQLMKDIASKPHADHAFQSDEFDQLISGNFTKRFVENIECIPPPPRNEPRCECWYKPDLLVCPLVQAALDYECGGGYGTFNYQCTQEEQSEEDNLYLLFNILSWVYKFVFVMSLRLIFSCRTIDLGKTNFLCFEFVPVAYLFLLAANLALILATYLSRCFMPLWAVFYVIFLHIDVVVCIANMYMNQTPKAPPPVPPPRSNLELFAYTNNKKGWKEKAYNTVELRGAKKAEAKLRGDKMKFEKASVKRKESIRKKGFSMKGAGLI